MEKYNTNISMATTTSVTTFTDFVNAFKLPYDKEATKNIPAIEKTNTRIGLKSANILGNVLRIPAKNDYKQFLDLYRRDYLLKKGKREYYTEKQIVDDGPILIDLDFHYETSITTRQHTSQHVHEFIIELADQLKSMFQFDDDIDIEVYIFQKDNVNVVEEKGITKDGVHIIIGCKCDRASQLILRNRMINKISTIFAKLPLKNSPEDIYDYSVTSGGSNWQLFGSMKPNHKPYKLSNVYRIGYDEDDEEIIVEENDLSCIDPYNNTEDLWKLSARNDEHPSLFFRSSFMDEYNAFKSSISNKVVPPGSPMKSRVPSGIEFDGSNRDKILALKNPAELALLRDKFIESFDKPRDIDREIKEIYDYVMALPSSYYENGSYSRWIRVCWALSNALSLENEMYVDRLLFVWVDFSAQSSTFAFNTIPDLISRWDDARYRLNSNDNPLTVRSIMFWVKEDNPSKFKEIQSVSIEHIIDKIIYGPSKGSVVDMNTIVDDLLAELLHKLYGSDHVCTSPSRNFWYRYINGRWRVDDGGNALRMKIKDLKKYFMKRLTSHQEKPPVPTPNGTIDKDAEKQLKQLRSRILQIYQKLGDSSFKKKVMEEARGLFYDEEFVNLLDTNKDLICFANGVVDMKQGVFRPGRPDDFISLTTGVNYIDDFQQSHQDTLKDIKQFIAELFPNESLRMYVMDHLASLFTGHNHHQNAHFYIGGGANGKSALIDLLSLSLGEYKGDVPASLIFDKRGKVGSTAPEIVALKGKRLAVIQEPSKTEEVNEGVFKQLTSANDPVSGRALYDKFPTTFIPQYKLVIATNYLPKINATDHGTWRRVAVVPYESFFTDTPVANDPAKPYQFKVDRKIADKFAVWKEVFASYLVKLAIETQGMVKPCEAVLERSKEYQSSQDAISEFIHDKIRVDDKTMKISKTDLVSEFTTWHAATYGKGGPTARDLYDYFTKKFGNPKNSSWYGLRIVYGNDSASDSENEEDDDIEGMDETDWLNSS